MIKEFKKALVLAPHTDDGEFGCGGTINRLLENGCEVAYIAFSSCRQSVPPQFPEDILITEVKEATAVLGIKPENLSIFDYDVRVFNYSRQPILDDLIKLRKDIQPDIVFMPSVNDVHQDHSTIANEGLRAFKWSSIFCYELPWNNFSFNNQCFISLAERHVVAKISALAKYESQTFRNYAGEDFIKSLASVRGVQSGNLFAEVFEVVRLIIN
jgi:N-acetylglucosamine malate deacetylase 1